MLYNNNTDLYRPNRLNIGEAVVECCD